MQNMAHTVGLRGHGRREICSSSSGRWRLLPRGGSCLLNLFFGSCETWHQEITWAAAGDSLTVFLDTRRPLCAYLI